jgi:hypothetical protein
MEGKIDEQSGYIIEKWGMERVVWVICPSPAQPEAGAVSPKVCGVPTKKKGKKAEQSQ